MENNAENLKHQIVKQVILDIDGDIYDVSSFSVSYVLDNLPSCNVVLATGRSVDTEQDDKDYSKIQSNVACTLKMTLVDFDEETKEHVLLKGFIQGIDVSDNSSGNSRSSAIALTLRHIASVLAGSSAVSYAYSKDQALTACSNLLFVPPQMYVQNTTGTDSIYSYDKLHKVVSKPDGAAILEQLIIGLSQDQPTEYLVDFVKTGLHKADGTAIDKFALGNFNFVAKVSTRYLDGWTQSNAWSGLVNAANYVFLNIVPYASGIYIANPLNLYRTPALTLTPDEYVSYSLGNRNRATLEPVDGVIVQIPNLAGGVADSIVVFPATDANAIVPGNFYHRAQLPDWTYEYANYAYGTSSGKVNKGNKGAVDTKLKSDPGNSKNITQALAKIMYAFQALPNRLVSIRMPFRDDIMPGTVLKIEAEDVLESLNTNLYGMINAIQIVGEVNPGSASLYMSVSISAIRTEVTNSNDNYTFTEHPLYGKVWGGCKLNGDLLDA